MNVLAVWVTYCTQFSLIMNYSRLSPITLAVTPFVWAAVRTSACQSAITLHVSVAVLNIVGKSLHITHTPPWHFNILYKDSRRTSIRYCSMFSLLSGIYWIPTLSCNWKIKFFIRYWAVIRTNMISTCWYRATPDLNFCMTAPHTGLFSESNTYRYLRRRSYVCHPCPLIGLFGSRIRRFPSNRDEGWIPAHKRPHTLLVGIQIKQKM